MLGWMAWTLPTAIFFIAVAVMLATMTMLQLAWPTVERKGFLPMSTTRGDRLFIGLLAAAYIHLAWLGLAGAQPLWHGSIVALICFLIVMRWG